LPQLQTAHKKAAATHDLVKWHQSCKWASFWSPNPARARNHKPEPGQSWTFTFEARFRPES